MTTHAQPRQSPRRALILVAGVGRRLLPDTADGPKCLVDLNGKSILRRQLEALHRAGVDEWVFVTGYRREMVRETITSWKLGARSMDWRIAPEFETTNTLVSVNVGAPGVAGQEFLLLNGDLWLRTSEVSKLVSGSDRTAMLVDTVSPLDEEAMKVELDADGRIHAISKTLAIGTSAGEAIGAYRFRRSDGERFLARVAAMADTTAGRTSYYEAALDPLLAEGMRSDLVEATPGRWAEIDDHADLARARAALAAIESAESAGTSPTNA
ncbi:MAG: phosphocholine cytidylyltransferase family protein [Myxococcota bacterium]